LLESLQADAHHAAGSWADSEASTRTKFFARYDQYSSARTS